MVENCVLGHHPESDVQCYVTVVAVAKSAINPSLRDTEMTGRTERELNCQMQSGAG